MCHSSQSDEELREGWSGKERVKKSCCLYFYLLFYFFFLGPHMPTLFSVGNDVGCVSQEDNLRARQHSVD